MSLETAAKILDGKREGAEEFVYGEFWIEDELYNAAVKSVDYVEGVIVELEPGDMGDHRYGNIVSPVETHVGLHGEDRALVGKEGEARIPREDDEFEAYILKALKNNSSTY